MRWAFLAMVNWYFYAPASVKRQPAWTRQEVHETCLWAIRSWSIRHNLDLRQSHNHIRPYRHARST